MQEQGAKPTDFGLSIRSSDRMTVTNPNKMQQARVTTVSKSFSGKKPQMVNIEKSADAIKSNFVRTEQLIKTLGETAKIDPIHHTCFWNNVDLNLIIEYLSNFTTSIDSDISSPLKWADYLKRLLEENKYNDANVSVISIQRGEGIEIAGLKFNPSERLISAVNESNYYISTLRSAQDMGEIEKFCNNDKFEKPTLLIYPLKLRLQSTILSFDECHAIGLSIIFPSDDIPTIKETQNTVYLQNNLEPYSIN